MISKNPLRKIGGRLGLKFRNYMQFPMSASVIKMCTFRNEGNENNCDWSDMKEAVSSKVYVSKISEDYASHKNVDVHTAS